MSQREQETKEKRLAADLTWTGSAFESGLAVEIRADGRFGEVGPARGDEIQLARRALIPGFCNAHSHAFQRGLRGRGESFPKGAGSFWTWREAMYGLVESMTSERIYELSHRAFREMLTAGMTSVGEFHYLHHSAAGQDFAFDKEVLRAASDTGIRIAMLLVFYGAPGLAGEEWSAGQLRFRTELPAYWDQLDALAAKLDRSTQSLGVVAHSIRAVGIPELAALHEGARDRGLVFHMHVEEQPREIADCRARHGRTPMGVLCSELALDDRFTAVHCTHTDPEEMAAFIGSGANVCICPLTEANLGDGIADVRGIRGAGGSICLGSDSNARISMFEEARWLEYVQRVSREERGVCLDESGELGPELMRIATKNGARSLGLAAGAIETDAHADLVAIDLDAPSLAGVEEVLANALMLGARDDVIAEVCVGGRWLKAGV